MSAFTPGPWAYSTSNEGWTFDIHQADDAGYTKESSDVATLYARTIQCDPKTVQQANARLIAASPELYDHLDLLCIWLNAALKCKNFVWDADQYEAATISLADARAELSKVKG